MELTGSKVAARKGGGYLGLDSSLDASQIPSSTEVSVFRDVLGMFISKVSLSSQALYFWVYQKREQISIQHMELLSSYFDMGHISSRQQYADTFNLNKMCSMICFVARGSLPGEVTVM